MCETKYCVLQVDQYGSAYLRRLIWWVQELKNIELPSKPVLELLSAAAEVIFSSKASKLHFQEAVFNSFQMTVSSSRFHVIPLALGPEWLKNDCNKAAEREEDRSNARAAMDVAVSDYIILNLGQVQALSLSDVKISGYVTKVDF